MRWNFERNSLLGRALRPHVEQVLLRSLKRSLRGVYLKGELIPPPFVLAMNHHSFFDGHLVWLLFRHAKVRGSLLISEENLRAFPVLAAAGALSTRRLREALRRLEAGEAVAIFPEGELRPAGPLGALQPGAVWLAQKARVPLLPVGSRVWLRGYEHPEAFLLVGEPVEPTLPRLEEALRALLSALDALHQATHPRAIPSGFSPILAGRRSLDERLARLFRGVPPRDWPPRPPPP
ncbi:MAG: 1-acyl-sn-glycerol-3-phosphate acyltransferase [Candidatus Bipolaricaulota bacterium]|nr:1-acyl-sn-glycerol-3-phosphate acyltransferase [Candidatus Bipolaricaulota bacterium]